LSLLVDLGFEFRASSYCVSLPSAGITGVHHVWFV
jgi:hypothetical protein